MPSNEPQLNAQTISPNGKAEYLASVAWPATLLGSLSCLFGEGQDARVYRRMLDNYLDEVIPSGPIERMLAEQLFLAHYLSGQLQVKAVVAQDAEVSKIYLNAGARLMSEFRASALALKTLQTPASPPELTPTAPQLGPGNPAEVDGKLGSNRTRLRGRPRAQLT